VIWRDMWRKCRYPSEEKSKFDLRGDLLSDPVAETLGYGFHTNIWQPSVYLYVAFSGWPRNMRGHRPQVCCKGVELNYPLFYTLLKVEQMENIDKVAQNNCLGSSRI
jgi:hypothetical protein